MNDKLFQKHTDMLIEILDTSLIDQKEKDYRKNTLLNVYNKMKRENKIYNRYYELSHEIRSLEFLEFYGNVQIANDRKSKEAGCDFLFDCNYQIECVCSSSGNEKINGLDKFHGSGVFDYNKKENIILTRFTKSIDDKVKFYFDHLKNGTISENNPYIIFLGIGNLSYGTFVGKFGFVLNKVLFGVGSKRLHYDLKENKFIKMDYTYTDAISNHNGAEIECNIFNNKKNDCISAIVYSVASLDERYDKTNTFLFINPLARKKIKVNIFKNLIYWRKNKDGLYLPRCNGKSLNNRLKEKWL